MPEYKIEEDRFIKEILENYGYKVVGIDSRKIVESNSVLHCISRTLPCFTKGSRKWLFENLASHLWYIGVKNK